MVRNIDHNLASAIDPPHAPQAEKCLLASFMRMGADEKPRWSKVWALLGDERTFFSVDNQIIAGKIKALHAAGKVADVTTVREALKAAQLLDEIGGQEYLADLWLSAPHAAQAGQYAEIVRERAIRRGLIEAANEALRRAYGPVDEDGGAELIATELAARAAKIATTGRGCDVHRLGDVAVEVYESKGDDKPVERITTGLRDLDLLIGGVRRGGMALIAGRPGDGKTTLIKQTGLNMSRRDVRFGVVSIEESRRKIAENLLSNASGVVNNRIAFNKLQKDDWGPFTRAVADLSSLPFFIVDSARRLSSIVAAIHTLHYEYGCEVIAVDHIHIIDPEASNRETREREISKISAELKWCFKDLNVAGVLAAQLNRTMGTDRPTLTSLRDSGSLEQDGDVIVLLHREDRFRDPQTPPDNVLELHVLKNKDGATGMIPAHYDGARQSVTDRGDVFQ